MILKIEATDLQTKPQWLTVSSVCIGAYVDYDGGELPHPPEEYWSCLIDDTGVAKDPELWADDFDQLMLLVYTTGADDWPTYAWVPVGCATLFDGFVSDRVGPERVDYEVEVETA